MAQTIGNTANFVQTVAGTTHSSTLTLGSGTSRKVTVIVFKEQTIGGTVSGVTFDGNAMTERDSAVHSGDGNLIGHIFTYDVPDGVGAGAKTIVATTTVSTVNVTWFAWETVGSASGAPEYAQIVEANNSGSSISDSAVAATAGAAILGAVISGSPTPTTNSWTVLTERAENNETNYTTAYADAEAVTAGTKTVTVAWSATSGFKLLAVVSIAEGTAAAPRRIRPATILKAQAATVAGSGSVA